MRHWPKDWRRTRTRWVPLWSAVHLWVNSCMTAIMACCTARHRIWCWSWAARTMKFWRKWMCWLCPRVPRKRGCFPRKVFLSKVRQVLGNYTISWRPWSDFMAFASPIYCFKSKWNMFVSCLVFIRLLASFHFFIYKPVEHVSLAHKHNFYLHFFLSEIRFTWGIFFELFSAVKINNNDPNCSFCRLSLLSRRPHPPLPPTLRPIILQYCVRLILLEIYHTSEHISYGLLVFSLDFHSKSVLLHSVFPIKETV